MALDVQKIRQDFPILKELVHGKPLVYLDNAATSQRPVQVLKEIEDAYLKYNSNIHRGVHHLSQKATEAHENSREVIREFINAKSTKEIIFTRGTTESINLIAWSFGERFCEKGDEIIISAMEHHSNIVPWQMLCERKELKLKVIPFDDSGTLDMDAFQNLISPKTKLVSVAHVSNTLGTVNPIEKIISIAHENNIKVLIDGAQSAPHFKLDMQALNADFFVFSSHKMYGPTGMGVLYGKEDLLNELPPYQGGGEMIETVTFEKTTYNELPFKFEAGTPDFTGSVGFAAGIKYIETLGIDSIHAYEDELLKYATEQLKSIPGLKIYGEAEMKSSVISFMVNGIHPFDMGTLLDQMGIAVRTGHHCAQPVMDRFGISGTVRASFAIYNTKEEVDTLLNGINRIAAMF
ncbi:aminotransferase class V-fold PLP-dependent enzyme [Saccharicrinis sp. FJH62]|uniref:aminotransferase class V-fold PLP-dependent enzyme n=1 Tax=Saccharicrinis sp. FJH62 TaxID=3344657 RepID=UPI0035D48C02